MKSATKKLLALALAALMVLPLAACGQINENTDGTKPAGNGESAVEESKGPSVAQNDYGEEFVALYCADTFREGYFFIEEDERKPGSDIDDKVYERVLKTEEYLGVDIIAENGGIYTEYTGKLETAVTAGDDAYQMVLTHVYQGVSNFITQNRIRPFGDFSSINLEADYWSTDLMEDLAINDHLYLGYNDFCLSSCYVIGFNKDMVTENQKDIGDSTLYELVEEQKWTLDKFINYSKLVYKDSNGNSTADIEDTYGFAGLAWVPLISFQLAADIPIVAREADTGRLYVSPLVDNKDKISELDEMIYDFINDKSTFTWAPLEQWGNTESLHLASGRVMFETLNNFDLVSVKESDVKVGVLPYPKWDEKQENYKTMSWNGYIVIPTTVKNLEMVGDTVEMLAYNSGDVTTAFYETLLGAKVADAPDDVKMLDIIWATQVSDYAMALNNVSPALDSIIYAIPHHTTVPSTPVYSTYVRKNTKQAETALAEMFEKDAENAE